MYERRGRSRELNSQNLVRATKIETCGEPLLQIYLFTYFRISSLSHSMSVSQYLSRTISS